MVMKTVSVGELVLDRLTKVDSADVEKAKAEIKAAGGKQPDPVQVDEFGLVAGGSAALVVAMKAVGMRRAIAVFEDAAAAKSDVTEDDQYTKNEY